MTSDKTIIADLQQEADDLSARYRMARRALRKTAEAEVVRKILDHLTAVLMRIEKIEEQCVQDQQSAGDE